MCLLLCELFEFFDDGLVGIPAGERLCFTRAKRESSTRDFIAVLPPDSRNSRPEPKDFDGRLKEAKPRLVEFVRFDVTDSEVLVSLRRELSFRSGLKAVGDLGEKYGTNDLLAGKIVCLKKDVRMTATSLTELRILKVFDVVSRLVSYCGGTIVADSVDHDISPDVNLILTYKSTLSKNEVQNLMLIGTVNGSKKSPKSNTTPDDYEKSRTKDIKSMCDNKLERNCTFKNVSDLVHTTISFDLIQTNLRKPVILNLQEAKNSETSSCKGALFVMYNFVRLSTLVSKYQDLVKSSVYPTLPELDNTDLSLLTQNEEWKIMLDFILYWPVVVKEVVEGLEIGKPKIHLLFKYLTDFSTTFSLYYHRIKILTEPRPHLIPVLHARVHLMLGLLQVVKNAFNVICLQPLNHM
ncbi:DALR anticodon-binding domain-containing protein 3 isoform X2 [Cimex lectularius]|uniref:DALR anticodon binding domain-containing protein n=1 Tax=Cimex lectularius TaxID=79782 RepID=A0A8I6SG82_CIMLE|nr:DALR anticodon-binding domain-containing protein 3 isoform X2 [Cimex lectularius]